MTIHALVFTEAVQVTSVRRAAAGFLGRAWPAYALVALRGATPATTRALTANTAYSVGDLCYSGLAGMSYMECVTAGTTEATINNIYMSPSSPHIGRRLNQLISGSWGQGTTAWRWRGAYTWAGPRGGAGHSPVSYANLTNYIYVESTFEATAVSTYGDGSIIISASPVAGNKLTTYLAGAKAINTETTYGTMGDATGGVVRGFTIGRDKTDATLGYHANELYAEFISLYTDRYYDCYITSSAWHVADPLYRRAQISGRAIFVGCTFRNNLADPTAFFGSFEDYNACSTVSIGGTYIRSGAGLSGPLFGSYFRTISGNPVWGADSAFNIIGGITTGVTAAVQSYSLVDDAVFNNNRLNNASAGSPTPHIYGIDGKAYTHKEGRRATHVASSIAGAPFGLLADKDLDNTVGQIAVRANTTYKTGGAADGQGAFSTKVVLSREHEDSYLELWISNSRVEEGFTIAVDILVVIPAGSGITDICTEDFWMDAVYLDQANTMHGGFASTINHRNCPGLIHTNVAVNYLPASPASWTGAPIGGLSRRLNVVVSPRRKGPILLRFGGMLSAWSAFRSTTNSFDVYIDQKPVLGAAP